jgi:uncharacterized membrane protein
MSRLWAKCRGDLENLCILRVTARTSTETTTSCLICSRKGKELEEQMSKFNWTAVAVITIIALLVFQAVASLLGGWRYGGWGMMNGWGFAPFGWIGMLFMMTFMWLVPVGFVVLAVLGVAWLVRNVGGWTNLVSPGHTCPSCGRGVQSDWHNCPNCGTSLSK